MQVGAAHAAGLVNGLSVAEQLFLLLQKPDGCLKGEHRAATARCGYHANALLQCLSTLVLPYCRPAQHNWYVRTITQTVVQSLGVLALVK